MIKYIGDGAYLLGVPARDLTDKEWSQLMPEQRTAAEASGLYEIEKRPAKADKPSAADDKKDGA